MMKYILIPLIICVAIIAFVLLRKRKASARADVYVCLECGMKHCDCRKETRQDQTD